MKRVFVGIWLVVFALWPWAHFGLVRAYGIDPWKFAGWGTFAAPVFAPYVVLFRIELHGARTLDDVQAAKIAPGEESVDLRRAHRRYESERAGFGQLTPPPEQLGKILLEEHGQTGMVLVVVQTREISRTNSLMQTQLERFAYSDRDKVRAELEGGAPP